MDSLSEILQSIRLQARVFAHPSFCGHWAVDTSGTRQATFHIVTRGTCWLHLPDRAMAEPMRAGDLVVFPRDAAHVIADSEQLPDAEVPRNQALTDPSIQPTASLICGYFEFGEQRWNPLLASMPDHLVIRNEAMSATGHMYHLINFMSYEVESQRLGADVVINRLSDVLFIHVIRTYIEQHQPAHGVIAALADTRLAQGLNAFHQQPQAPWTIETLANAAGMSRSAFAEQFHRIVGQTPLQYMLQWRMQVAYDLLMTSSLSTQQIAERSGYQSEASFAKAFKKFYGNGPGAVRRANKL
ncbi:MAG: helix-turn-helix domain-containing protein [Gammaproteobacteria bacterium]|nr:helix-turn-helix domain-containing protein [Gammaproteobacteria bacterium]